MNTVINTGALVSLYLSILIITKKRANAADRILFLFFLLNSLIFFICFLSYEYGLEDLQFFLINIDLLSTPLWFLYIYYLITGEKVTFRKIIVHFIPYVVSFIYLSFLVLTMDIKEFDLVIYLPILKQPPLLGIVSILELIITPFYSTLSIILLLKHKKSVPNLYSYTKGVDLKWARTFVVLNMIGWVFIYFPYFINGDDSMLLGVFLNGLLILYLGFFVIRQTTLFIPLAEEKSVEKYNKSALTVSLLKEYKIRLIDYVIEEKPFLDNELNINKLSEMVGISSHNLSQVLSSEIGKSFYDFINTYRVEEFKRVVKQDSSRNFTLLAIAMDCGFNSKSSFNRIFKNITGITPTAYLKTTC